MPPRTPYDDDDDDRGRRDSRDASIGEKFADLASAIKDRTGEALEDMTDKLKKTKEGWEEGDRQRDRRHDNDDDDRPVFRGNRNYEGVGVGVGEALGDMATAVKRTTDRMVEEAKKSEVVNRLGNQVEQMTKDVRGESKSQGGFTTSTLLRGPQAHLGARHPPARAGGWGDDGKGKNTSNMPEGCYCDMRGWACPLHKGNEKWRQSHVFTQHVAYNDPTAAQAAESVEAARSRGGAQPVAATDGAAATDAAAADHAVQRAVAMAAAERADHVETLAAMGFPADAARAALQKYHSLAGATNALLDGEHFEGVPERAPASAAGGAGSSSQEPARVESAVFLGGPPSDPAPRPPPSDISKLAPPPGQAGAPAPTDLVGDLLGDLAGINLTPAPAPAGPPMAARLGPAALSLPPPTTQPPPPAPPTPARPAAAFDPFATAAPQQPAAAFHPHFPVAAPAPPAQLAYAAQPPPGFAQPGSFPQSAFPSTMGPPQQGYPPQQGHLPQGQGGYPQQPGYPPQQQGPQGYLPATPFQRGFPPAQHAMPAMHAGFPPPQPGFRPAQPACPPAQAAIGPLAFPNGHGACGYGQPGCSQGAASGAAGWSAAPQGLACHAATATSPAMVSRPVAHTAPPAAPAPVPAPAPAKAKAKAPVPAPRVAGGLPPGWQSGVDPSTGVTYYCNPSTNTTQWERPMASAPQPPTAAAAAASPGGAKQSLADMVSSSDIVDLDAAFAPPSAPPVAPPIAPPVAPSSVAAAAPPAPARSASGGADSLLGAGFAQLSQLVAEPPKTVAQAAPAVAAAAAATPTKAPAPAPAPAPRAGVAGALPPGWQSGVDPSTGVTYYCNPSTNTTQWERPMVA